MLIWGLGRLLGDNAADGFLECPAGVLVLLGSCWVRHIPVTRD
jgi:hypothetical protein